MGKVHHFSAGGLYNGLVLLYDDESGTYWDHITGEAVYGPLKGHCLEMWGIEMTDVRSANIAYPELLLLQSKPNLIGRLMGFMMDLKYFQGRFPPGFRSTMGDPDLRLPEMEIGLGVITDGTKCFYPKNVINGVIKDSIDNREIDISINTANRIPVAVWSDGTRPVQIFSRWYGFAYTFPDCEIYGISM